MSSDQIIEELNNLITRWLLENEPRAKRCAEDLSALRDQIVAANPPA